VIKKVRADQLKPGMFIHDFNCGWLNHPFVRNSTKIKDEQLIKKIVGTGIEELYIDTSKGTDVSNAPNKEEAKIPPQPEINSIIEERPIIEKSVPIQEELVKAKEIKEEAQQVVRDIMDEVRMGKEIKTEAVEPVVYKMIDSVMRNQDALLSLGRIKKIDEYTYIHSMSVAVLMISFCRRLGFGYEKLKEVGIGGMLHDIGKMKVEARLLTCKSRLTDEEYLQIRRHVEYGRAILEQTNGVTDLSFSLAVQHHERIDGKGYPEGLTGDEISLCGQAAAIVDVYDAMTSKRCYQRGQEPTFVLKKLYSSHNDHDPKLVEKFIRCIGIYPVGSLVRLESGLLGLILSNSENSLLSPVIRVIYDTSKEHPIYPPYDIDLSKASKDGKEGKVLSCESLNAWHVRAEDYI